MHLNYFLLRPLARALHATLHESTFVHAFSLSKEELVLSFLNDDREEFFITLHFVNKSCYLQFHRSYHRPKKNFLYQFESLNGAHVKSVEVIPYDRSFFIRFKTGHTLIFKLHGAFSNLILSTEGHENATCFRNEFAKDAGIRVETLHGNDDLLSICASPQPVTYAELQKRVPALDKACMQALETAQFIQLDIAERKSLVEKLFLQAAPPIYFRENGAASFLHILPLENTVAFSDAFEAYNQLARCVLPSFLFYEQKRSMVRQLETEIRQAERTLQSLTKRLENVKEYAHYESLGHLLMANLHRITPGTAQVEVDDFYSGKPVTIRLDKNLNAQENAGRYYKKAKALKEELPGVIQEADAKKRTLQSLKERLERVNNIPDNKTLKQFIKENPLPEKATQQESKPYRRVMVEGFEIRIGKHAAANDLLTFSFSHKNDTWLHARDVSGSHVIIRSQPGKIIGNAVLEKAAALAAYFSKAKSQGLVPVTYTLRKFVVKPKGSHPGEVHLLSQQTVLVNPQDAEPLLR